MIKQFCVLMSFVCTVLCFLCGCGNSDGASSRDGSILRSIHALYVRPSKASGDLYSSVSKICEEISSINNSAAQAVNYRALASRLSGLGMDGLEDGDKVLLFGDFWRSLSLVCSRLLDVGALDRESFGLIVEGWRRCLNAKDAMVGASRIDTGDGAEDVRLHARKFKGLFENDVTLFERDIMRLLFKNHGVSEKQQKEYYDIWHNAMGCRVKSHPEYQEPVKMIGR